VPSIFSKPKPYDWKRFWCPRDGILDLSDGGYLADPDSEERELVQSDSIPFECIEDVPCLGLLGEPGIGKTTWFNLRRNRAEAAEQGGQNSSLWLDLGSYDHLDDLLRAIFQSQEFLNWQNDLSGLQIFLDGLDELHINLTVCTKRLIAEFKKYRPLSRLFIRVLCRTANWPISFEQRLQELWGRESVQIFELAPLRRCDVEEVARTEIADDPIRFLNELESRGLVPFANRPQTLAFLIALYNNSGEFPENQVELYERGCRSLCREFNPDRIDLKQIGDLAPEERLIIASRLAALTIFGNRIGFNVRSTSLTDKSESWLSLDDICIGSELVRDHELHIQENFVKETIEYGLFSGLNSSLMRWAHQAYADFLAAYYLWKHHLALPQILNLIVHPRSHYGKIRPQLREVAGWLAAMKPEVHDYIIRHDPEVLVECTAEIRSQQKRKNLVTQLLIQCAEEAAGSQRFLSGRGQRKLCHAALADQLLPVIKDRTKMTAVRVRAIIIAHHCKIPDLLDILIELALNKSEELEIREYAAAVIALSNNPTVKGQLKDLALSEIKEDHYDALKGGALSAVWPDHVTAQELFDALTVPKRKNLVGQYSGFLHSHIMPHLRPNQLPIALAWVRDQHRKHSLPSSFRELSNKILAMAWEHLDSSNVLENYAEAAVVRLNMKCDDAYLDPAEALKILFSNDGDKRKQVTEAIVRLAVQAHTNTNLIAARLRDALLWEDFSWLIELLKDIGQKDIQIFLIRLVMYVFDRQDPEQELVLESVAQQCQPLRDELDRRRQKYLHQRPEQLTREKRAVEQQDEAADKASDASNPILSNQVKALLVQCEAGNYGKFFELAQLTIRLEGNAMRPDLTSCRFWQLAEPETRERILNAARHFLLFEDPADYETSDGRTADPKTSFVCYRILRLLFPSDPDLIPGGLPIGVWGKWAPVTLSFPANPYDKEFGLQVLLVEHACYFAPGVLIEALLRVIDQENEESGDSPVVAKLSGGRPSFVQRKLLEKVKDPRLTSKSFERLLHYLVQWRNPQAIKLAESLCRSDSRRKPELRDKRIAAAKLLLGFNATRSWPVLWRAITRDKYFGREILVQAFPQYYVQYEIFAQRLLPNQLADLFVWLHTKCPPLEAKSIDHDSDEGDVTKLDEIKSFILSDLRDRGTPEALDALGRISNELPSEEWIKKTLLHAEDRAIEMDWEPLLPEQFLAMVNHSRKRIVQSEAQLIEVVCESLNEYQKKLKQVELPSNRDRKDKHLYWPVDEKDFSDHVARHLREDLVPREVVVNREVEIRRTHVTDIHVDAVVKGRGDEDKRGITIIIEVKGCWNRKLFTGMKDQLADRYMKNNQCRHGLYLVGWFNCAKWHPDGRRKQLKKAREMTITQAQSEFDGQAAALSTDATKIEALVLDTSLP
jgi:hypothetical protein